jgi:NADPH:quinone reductase-like Zn-dependent oxidoreductase
MKALAISGPDEAPAVLEVPDPVPGAGEIRVSVEVASVNGFDLAVAAGKVWDTMPHEFPVVLGRDFVGTVDTVGDGVADLRVGDRVAGVVMAPGLGPGAIGEYVVTQPASVAVVPEGLSSTDAAAVGLAGVAGYDAAVALDVAEGRVVLIAGATGGVGSVATQLAAASGGTVIGSARPGDEESFVRSLGASHVVDYTGDVAAAVLALAPDGVDRALHAAGDATSIAAHLRPGGLLASMLGATSDSVGRDDITVTAVRAHATPEKLAELLENVADGRLKVHITTTISFDDAPDALAAFRSGTLGKVLITR